MKAVYFDLEYWYFELDDVMFENEIYQLLLQDDEVLNVCPNKVTKIIKTSPSNCTKHKYKDVCRKNYTNKNETCCSVSQLSKVSVFIYSIDN